MSSPKVPYALLSKDETYEAFAEENPTDSIDLELTGETLQLESNFDQTTIFINGKTIGKTISQMKEISPISFNGTIRVHGEQKFPWGLEKSVDTLLQEDTSTVDITPQPFTTEANRKPIIELINTFAKQEIQALIKHNPNLLTTIDDNFKASYINDINDDVKYNYTWKGKVLGTRIDFDRASLSKNDETGVYQVEIPVEVHANYKEYNEYEDKSKPTEDKIDHYHFILTYQEKSKKWLVSKRDDLYFNTDDDFSGKNTIKSEFH